MTSDLSVILPRVLIVSRRSLRKNKFVDFVGEYHLDLIVGYGAVPVIVPRVTGVNMLLDSFEPIHGVLLCEGEDIDPSLYEAEASNLSDEELEEIRRLHASDTTIDKEKDAIELGLAKLCLERNIPYLGICRGSQVLNVACGGTLYQDIGKELTRNCPEENRVVHMDYDNYDGHRHVVKVDGNTPLHHWFKDSLEDDKMEIWVNSYHHQGVKRLAQRFVPMAFAPDGLIEGFYDPDAYNPQEGKFIMGLQFHPERMRRPDSDEFDYPGCPSAYKEFVKAVVAYQKKLNSTTNVPRPLKLNQELEKKRNIIVRSFSLARNIYNSHGRTPSKEVELEPGADFLESNTALSLQQENRLKQMGATVRNASSYMERLKLNEERERDITIDPAFAKCNSSFVVPVFEKMAQDLEANSTSLVAALDGGFQLQWDVESDQCKNCTESGGACGYNLTDSRFICFCHDQSYLNTCPSRQGRDSSNSSTLQIVLPVVGAILAGIGIGWLFFFCRQRRKKQAVQSAEAENKDIPTPLSSKRHSTTNPSTNFTRSIPSYPTSTISDFAKSNYFGVQVFTYAELERATDNFDRSKELGDGGFGTVYYGKLIDGREVAVKHLYENNFKRLEQFINEVEILARLHHENLVKLYGCTSKRSRELLLVYEYIPNGTVADHLHGKRANSVSGLLSWPVRLNIAIETAVALAFLHESDIIHRDVKTNNILLDNNFRVKVADFGLSRLFPNDATHVSTAPQGTPGYVDPEYYQCYQLTDKSDVYSFGVVLIELISSLEAVDTNRHRHHINLANMGIDKIQNHKLHELVDKTFGFETDNSVRKMTTLVAELAFRCLQQDKDMRPTMKEVLEILRGIQNEQWNGQKPEVLDIVVDNGAILKDNASPPSPDSSVTDRLVGSTPNSSG